MSIPSIGLAEVFLLSLVCGIVPLTGALIAVVVFRSQKQDDTR